MMNDKLYVAFGYKKYFGTSGSQPYVHVYEDMDSLSSDSSFTIMNIYEIDAKKIYGEPDAV